VDDQIEIGSVADLVEEVRPYAGQDCELRYRVRTDKTLDTDETITGWTLAWTLFESVDDASAALSKTTVSGIAVSTPYATVTLSAANVTALTVGTEYGMQLWRNDSGNKYPLTGIGRFTVLPAPPLT